MKLNSEPPSTTSKKKVVAALAALGKTNKEIAEIVGHTPMTIGKWRRSNTFQLHLKEAEENMRTCMYEKAMSLHERFDVMAPRAAEILEALMDSAETETVKMKAVQEVLDRAPSAPKSRKFIDERKTTHIHLSMKVTDAMREAVEDVEEAEILELLGEDYQIEDHSTQIQPKSVDSDGD